MEPREIADCVPPCGNVQNAFLTVGPLCTQVRRSVLNLLPEIAQTAYKFYYKLCNNFLISAQHNVFTRDSML